VYVCERARARSIDRCASTSCFLGRSLCDTKLLMQMLELKKNNRSSLDYGFFTAIGYAEDFSCFEENFSNQVFGLAA
jgi:hypothetical protein